MTTRSVAPSEFDLAAELYPEQTADPAPAPVQTAAAAEAIAAFHDIDALYAAYHQRIFRFLLASLRNPDVAQTLTQDTFIRAWSARASFRGDCAPGTWLMRIAVNLLRDHTRTARFRFWKRAETVDAQEMEAHLAQPESGSEAQLIATQQVKLLWQTVATLPLQKRTVFALRFAEEMELTEIAEATGHALSTVKSHLYRALAAVRKAHLAQPGSAVEGRRRRSVAEKF